MGEGGTCWRGTGEGHMQAGISTVLFTSKSVLIPLLDGKSLRCLAFSTLISSLL